MRKYWFFRRAPIKQSGEQLTGSAGESDVYATNHLRTQANNHILMNLLLNPDTKKQNKTTIIKIAKYYPRT